MAPPTSLSIKPRGSENLSSEILALEKAFGSRLEHLDVDGDGRIDRTELLMFLRDVVNREKKMKYFKVAIVVLVSLLLLFALTTFGTVWAVVALTEKVETGGDSGTGKTGLALVSSSTGETLRTASGSLTLGLIAYNESVADIYQKADAQSRRRLLEASPSQTYIGELAPEEALAGCELLLEGHKDIVTTLPITQDGESTEEVELMNVSVMTASLAACRKAVAKKDVEGLRAIVYVAEYLSEVIVSCLTADSCQLFNATSESVSTNTDARRRLLGTSVDEVTLRFRKSGSVVCSAEQCTGEAIPAGRDLLGYCNQYNCCCATCNGFCGCTDSCACR